MSDPTQDPEAGTALAPRMSVVDAARIMSADQFDNVFRMAKALAASHMFKDVTQAEQAFGRILLGQDLGLSPTQALMVLDVVEGNIRVRSVQLAAWVRQHPDYDYAVAEHDDQHCVIDFYYHGETCGTSAFSMEDAAKAQLIKDNPRSAWKAHPRNMLWARAMSNGVRWYCPEVTGGMPVYTEADSFEDRATASIGAGEGSGEGPGWGDMAPELVERVEAIIARASKVGLVAFATTPVIQQRLYGHPEQVVKDWIAQAEEQVAAVEDVPEAEVVEP